MSTTFQKSVQPNEQGRITIPAGIRKSINLQQHDRLLLSLDGERITITVQRHDSDSWLTDQVMEEIAQADLEAGEKFDSVDSMLVALND